MSSSQLKLHGWSLWVLDLQDKKSRQLQLLYSWVVPLDAQRATGWLGKAEALQEVKLTLEKKRTLRCQLWRATYVEEQAVIRQLIDRLLRGESLEQAFANEGRVVQDAPLRQLSLAPASYARRPEVFLTPGHPLLPVGHRPLPGPLEGGCFVTSTVDLVKAQLQFWGDNCLSNEQKARLWLAVATAFQTASGFDLRKDSASRLGNLEWYRWGPWYGPTGHSHVDFWAVKTTAESATAATVRLRAAAGVAVGTPLLVRCRLLNDHETTLDQVQPLCWTGEDQLLHYQSTQPVSGIEVAIWGQPTDGAFELQYERHAVLLRQLTFHMGMIGTQYATDTPLLLEKAVRADTRNVAAVKPLRRFSRTSADKPLVVGTTGPDAWIEAGREKLSEMSQLFPASSEGRFFPRGWDEHAQASGSVAFYQWLQNLFSQHEHREIWLLDPFFDAAGVDVFARATSSHAKFRVLTNSQVASFDDEAAPSPAAAQAGDSASASVAPTEPPRASRIRQACRHLLPLLDGLDLQIQDLRSPGTAGRQLFHDRYLLVRDAQQRVIKGFHLSNSIQGATKTAPLLVTPIPADVLNEVTQYVQRLLNPGTGSADSQARVEQLYPEVAPAAGAVVTPTAGAGQDWLAALPAAPAFFAALYAQPALAAVVAHELAAALKSFGIRGAEAGDFALPAPAQLREVGQRMATDTTVLQDWWEVAGQLAARGHFYPPAELAAGGSPTSIAATLGRVLREYPAIGDYLRDYLASQLPLIGESTLTRRSRHSAFTLLQGDQPEEILTGTFQRLSHWSGDEGLGLGSWPARLAAELLADGFPGQAVGLLANLVSLTAAAAWNQADPAVRKTMATGDLLLGKLLRPWRANSKKISRLLLNSELLQLRMVGATLAFYEARPARILKISVRRGLQLFQQPTLLADAERRLALAQALARLPSPQQSFVDAAAGQSIAAARQELSAALVADWQGDEELIRRVIRLLAGPLYPDRSDFITRYFLLPLAQRAGADKTLPLRIWHEALLKKVAYRPEYGKGSAEDTEFGPTQLTDGELAAVVLRLLEEQPATQQLACLQDWKKELYAMRSFLRLPLVPLVQAARWGEVALRFAWLYGLLVEVSKQAAERQVREVVESLIQELAPDNNRLAAHRREYDEELLSALQQSAWEARGNI